jgi:hypothetical protein
MAVTVFVCLTLTAGCSGSDPITSSPAAATGAAAAPDKAADAADDAAAEPAAVTSALEGMSAVQVWRKTKADVKNAESVHITGSFIDGKERMKINLKLNSANQSFGFISIDGQKMTVRRLDKTLYLKASKKFWTKNADAQTGAFLANKWLKTKDQSGDMADFFDLMSMDALLTESLKMTAAQRKQLKRTDGEPVAGQETVELKTKSNEYDVLSIAAADPALPLGFTMAKDKSQFLKFQDWSKPFTVTAPKKNVIDADAPSQ